MCSNRNIGLQKKVQESVWKQLTQLHNSSQISFCYKMIANFILNSYTQKGVQEPKAQTAGAYPGFLSMKHALEYCYSPLDGMLVRRRATPSSISPVPIYTPGWRNAKWSKVSCLRKRRDGSRLELLTPDPEFEVLVARPYAPSQGYVRDNCYAEQFFRHIWLTGSLISQWVQLAD